MKKVTLNGILQDSRLAYARKAINSEKDPNFLDYFNGDIDSNVQLKIMGERWFDKSERADLGESHEYRFPPISNFKKDPKTGKRLKRKVVVAGPSPNQIFPRVKWGEVPIQNWQRFRNKNPFYVIGNARENEALERDNLTLNLTEIVNQVSPGLTRREKAKVISHIYGQPESEKLKKEIFNVIKQDERTQFFTDYTINPQMSELRQFAKEQGYKSVGSFAHSMDEFERNSFGKGLLAEFERRYKESKGRTKGSDIAFESGISNSTFYRIVQEQGYKNLTEFKETLDTRMKLEVKEEAIDRVRDKVEERLKGIQETIKFQDLRRYVPKTRTLGKAAALIALTMGLTSILRDTYLTTREYIKSPQAEARAALEEPSQDINYKIPLANASNPTPDYTSIMKLKTMLSSTPEEAASYLLAE